MTNRSLTLDLVPDTNGKHWVRAGAVSVTGLAEKWDWIVDPAQPQWFMLRSRLINALPETAGYFAIVNGDGEQVSGTKAVFGTAAQFWWATTL
jgi:hypothetical protein